MKIVDSFMPEVMVQQLHDLCTSKDFPWYVMSDPTYETEDGVVSFAHLAVWEGMPVSHISARLESILRCIANEAGEEYDSIYRVRFGLYLPVHSEAPVHNKVHTDLNFPHKVALYYVNASDGPTHLFGNINTTVEPKMGRLVVFDGSTPHASSCPMYHNLRITLNVNFATKT